MENREENKALIAFTTLSPLPVGGLIGLLLLRGPEPPAVPDTGCLILLGVGLLALTASLFHLGRPLRAYRALQHLSASWLSREVILFGLFIASLAVFALPLIGNPTAVRSVVGPLAAFIGLLALVATGEVYHLRSRPSWEHRTATLSFPLGAFSAGLLVGIPVANLNPSAGTAAGNGAGHVATIAVAALVLALVTIWFRAQQLLRGGGEARETWKLISGQFRWALVLRAVGLICALAMLLSGWAIWLAWMPAVLGELADRILFFYAVVPVSLPARSGVPLSQVARGLEGQTFHGNSIQ